MTALAIAHHTAHTAGHHLTMGQSTAVVALFLAIAGVVIIYGIRKMLGFGKPKSTATRTYRPW